MTSPASSRGRHHDARPRCFASRPDDGDVQLAAAEQARRYKQLLDAMSPACGVDLARKALETP